MQRIQRQNQVRLQMFADILKPEVLHTAVPRLATAAEGARELRSMNDELSALGAYCRVNGFDPTRKFQHVAHIEQSIWSAILEAFGKFDEETGVLQDDGLLYRTDIDGTIKLNKPFFYALITYLDANGYECDMRNKIKLA
jgi:hypothetical protein